MQDTQSTPPISPGFESSSIQQNSTSNILPPEPRKVSHKLNYAVLGGIILMLLVVIGVMAVRMQFSSGNQAPTQTTQQTLKPLPTMTATPTTDPTADWNTESYEKLSLKYPQDWTSERVFLPLEALYISPQTNGDYATATISIYTLDNPDSLTVPEYYSTLEGPKPPHYSSSATVKGFNNISGYYQEDVNCEPVACDTFIFTGNGKIFFSALLYPSIVSGEESSNIFRGTFNQILSTFEFTN